MQHDFFNLSQATQGIHTDDPSSPHISPTNLAPSHAELSDNPVPLADPHYPPIWESHPILPGPPRRPKEYQKSPFPGKDSWPSTPTLPPTTSVIVGTDGRGWLGRGPARTENSVFPGVDSWPASPVLGGPTATPPPITSSSSPSSSPVTTLQQHHTPPHPAIIMPPYMPSPPHVPRTPSCPLPPAQQRPRPEEDDYEDSHWYSVFCCTRRRAKRRIESVV